MKKFVMIIDVAKCNNCNACAIAVKDEYVGNDFAGYSVAQPKLGHSWLKVDQVSRGSGAMVDFTYIPTMCNHCENAPCISAAGDGSVYKRGDGIVIMDPERTKGRRDIEKSCPYGMIYWNDEKDVPQTWIFDAHLIDNGWETPRCVNSCPSGCFEVRKVTDDEFNSMLNSQEYDGRQNKYKKTRPRILYKGLKSALTGFIGGNVTTISADRRVNADGVLVLLGKEGVVLMETATDIFGDFKFDLIPYNSGVYDVRVADRNRQSIYLKSVTLLGECVVIDDICI